MRYLTIILLLSIFCQESKAQSGWTRAKKTYFAKVAYNFFQSSNYYNLEGEKMSTARFRQQAITFYGEYGITDNLTVIANFPIVKSNGFETTETVYGIGDLKLEFKYALLKKKNIPLTISIAPEFPTGSRDNYAQNKINSFERINLPTGDGEFNVWTTLAGSVSFYPVNAYLSGHLAYNYRTSYKDYDFRDQFKFGLEAGYKLADVVWINALLQAQQSLGQQAGMTDFVRGDGTAFTAFGLGAAYEIVDHWSISALYWNYADLVIDRKNIYSDPTWSIGVFYEIK
jgi:hypothetical protein